MEAAFVGKQCVIYIHLLSINGEQCGSNIFFAACDDGLLIGYAIKVMIGQMMQMEIFFVK